MKNFIINLLFPQTFRTPAELEQKHFKFFSCINKPQYPGLREWGTR